MGLNFKKLPWGRIAKVGAGIGEMLVPGVGLAIRAAEAVLGDDGKTKLEKAQGLTDAFLPVALGLTKTEAALPQIQRLRTELIENVVLLENAKAQVEQTKEAIQAAVDAIKATRPKSDGTGEP